MINILLIEDEKKLANFLLRGLSNEGYHCEWVSLYSDILGQVESFDCEVILLDRLMQTNDTLDLMPSIRERQPKAMILMLTALHDIEQKVLGLRAGADDYLGKPFDFDELLARIEALLRRSSTEDKPLQQGLGQGLLKMHVEAQRVWVADAEVELTQLEFQVLRYFLSNPNMVLSRERILSKVWGSMSDPLTNIVDVYIRRIRKKLASAVPEPDAEAAESFIETIRGAGYRLGACK